MANEIVKKPIIGPKIKLCLILTWAWLLFLTYTVLALHKNLGIQLICLVLTMIAFYIQLLLIQDYYYLRLHSNSVRCRKDIRLLEPLLLRKKKVKQNDR